MTTHNNNRRPLFSPICLFLLFAGLSHLNGQADSVFAAEIRKFRESQFEKLTTGERAPLRTEDLKYLRFFEPNEQYRIHCMFTRTPDEQPFEMPTSSGITKPFVKYGVLTFTFRDTLCRLTVYRALPWRHVPMSATQLFLPFRDLTSGVETYGGGRYLDLHLSDVKDGKIWLDFNRSYNPWCCYADGYNCPIPPPENSLNISIRAGEKMWAKEK